MNRGDRREPIFQDDADRQRFVETLGEVCVRSGWQVHAYCLMPSHALQIGMRIWKRLLTSKTNMKRALLSCFLPELSPRSFKGNGLEFVNTCAQRQLP